jgi:hypothetical protein
VLRFLIFTFLTLLTLTTVSAPGPLESTRPELTVAPQAMPEAKVGAHPDEADSLGVPDGTPLRVKVRGAALQASGRPFAREPRPPPPKSVQLSKVLRQDKRMARDLSKGSENPARTPTVGC